MWLPSFVSVLQDLWLFCTGRAPVIPDTNLNQNRQVYAEREVSVAIPRNHVHQLQADIMYTADHTTTVGIRSDLNAYDSHLVQSKTLTIKEWLLYVVHKKNSTIPLLALQLTPVGRWHSTLKGQSGVSVGISPYSSALMEWVDTGNDEAAVVLKVTPDETITIGELGKTKGGLYETRVLSKRQWLELRPVFTTFV